LNIQHLRDIALQGIYTIKLIGTLIMSISHGRSAETLIKVKIVCNLGFLKPNPDDLLENGEFPLQEYKIGNPKMTIKFSEFLT
jgi:hypothetical protein